VEKDIVWPGYPSYVRASNYLPAADRAGSPHYFLRGLQVEPAPFSFFAGSK
jgi:hypothetical protein